MGVIQYFINNHAIIAEYAKIHFSLAVLAISIAILLWIPVGIAASYNEKISSFAINIASLIMCIPGLALLSILIVIPFMGLGMKSATTALVLYAMLPLVMNTCAGLKSVDSSVIEAAKGMGMSTRKILLEVKLPLALPVIFAGIRVMVVMITGMCTLATFIGVKTLGRLIHQGIARSNMDMVITGAILTGIISLLVDCVMGLIQNKLSKKLLGSVNQKEYDDNVKGVTPI
ncbi:MAG: ABC transporter permease [Dehalobacterium sp.]